MNAAFTLAPGEVVRVDRAIGIEVAVDSGRVWVTEERSFDDVWLAAGESVRLAGRGLAIVEAVGGAAIRVRRHGA
ncbi:MAG TPA: DUF2917 domain-containing protein [Usitatibacter sp.]|nr:DUF2917 domain-containing protein [Usitatibacter sp.]